MPERKPCRGCGAPKPKQAGWNYCPDCRGVYAEKRRKDQRANSDGWAARNPEMRRAADRRRKAAAKPPCELCGVNPKASDYESGKHATRYCADCAEIKAGERREKARLNSRAWFEKNGKAVYAKRREVWAAMSEAEREAERIAYNAYRRGWYADSDTAKAQRRMHVVAYRARKREAFVEYIDHLVVLEMDDGICGICGEDVDPFNFHVDHVIPVIKGGEDAYYNVQVAHPTCNKRKGDRLLLEEV